MFKFFFDILGKTELSLFNKGYHGIGKDSLQKNYQWIIIGGRGEPSEGGCSPNYSDKSKNQYKDTTLNQLITYSCPYVLLSLYGLFSPAAINWISHLPILLHTCV